MTTKPSPEAAPLPRTVDLLIDTLFQELGALMIIGPRAIGKTTSASAKARSRVHLDRPAEAAALVADPDVALAALEEPILLDEWQFVPGVFGAVKRSMDAHPGPGRFLLTGSVLARSSQNVYPGTGRIQTVTMFPLTEREVQGRAGAPNFFDRLTEGGNLAQPKQPPDILGYLNLASRSGFPEPALRLGDRARRTWLESYVDDLLTHDVPQVQSSATRQSDPERLRRYLEAWTLNSAGCADHKTIYEAAGLRRETGESYQRMLTDLMVIETVPNWATNRLARMTRQPKRYVVDPGLMMSILRVDPKGVLADGDLLGRTIDSFVAAQLRPEIAAASTQPRLHHLRTKNGRQEIDLIAEFSGDQVVAIEIKSSAAPNRSDARHLIWLKQQLGPRFLHGIVFHTGPDLFQLDDRITAAPIASIWA